MNYTTHTRTQCGVQDAPAMLQAKSEAHLPPLHVRLPDMRSSLAVSKPQAMTTETCLPMFEGVDAALNRNSNKSRKPALAVQQTRHSSHGSSRRTAFSANIDSAEIMGASWKPVVLLILVLLAAAGMTLWITFGSTWTSTTSPKDSTDPARWVPASTAGQFAEDFQTTDTMVSPYTRPAVAQYAEQCPTWSERLNTTVDIQPFVSHSVEHLANPPHYPMTGCKDVWQQSPMPAPKKTITTDTVANTTPSTAIVPTARHAHAPVSFEGHIETPNLRARHDRHRSILH